MIKIFNSFDWHRITQIRYDCLQIFNNYNNILLKYYKIGRKALVHIHSMIICLVFVLPFR